MSINGAAHPPKRREKGGKKQDIGCRMINCDGRKVE
jgi:hypothetical protein